MTIVSSVVTAMILLPSILYVVPETGFLNFNKFEIKWKWWKK